MLRYGIRTVTDAGPHGVVLFCLLASLAGVLAGCSSGTTVAPVQLPTKPVIPAREREYALEYVVESGDTVYSIAWRHGIDYRVLAEFNSIRDPFTIFPGQHLRIPGLDDTTSPVPKPRATTSEPTTSSDVSVHGIDTESALQPLPSPPQPSGPSAKLPDETPREGAGSAARAGITVEACRETVARNQGGGGLAMVAADERQDDRKLRTRRQQGARHRRRFRAVDPCRIARAGRLRG